jgi:hypothetical protein
VLPGSSVIIRGDNVTIKLGECPTEYLDTVSDFLPSGLTANPGNARMLEEELGEFWTINGSHVLVCKKDDDNQAWLMYADRNVTITGTNHGEIYNMSMKKGWNYCFDLYNEATNTETATASTTLPSGFTWKVMTRDSRH